MAARLSAPLVLIADADPYLCRVFEARLNRDNLFRSVTTTTVMEAYSASIERPFDVIVWDVRLRDSTRFLPLVRALSPQAALIVMTTDDLPVVDSELARLDIVEVLIKPFGLDALVERVRASLAVETHVTSVSVIDIGHVGQQIRILSPGGKCVTRVLEAGTDIFTVVGAPRVPVPQDFHAGQSVQVEIQGEDALYRFASILLRALPDPVACWALKMPRIIRRYQRRRSPRVPLRLPVSLARTTVNDTDQMEVLGQTENVSAGGFLAVFEVELPMDSAVRFKIRAPNQSVVSGSGQIVRTEDSVPAPERQGRRSLFRIAVKFETLTAQSRRILNALLEEARVRQSP